MKIDTPKILVSKHEVFKKEEKATMLLLCIYFYETWNNGYVSLSF